MFLHHHQRQSTTKNGTPTQSSLSQVMVAAIMMSTLVTIGDCTVVQPARQIDIQSSNLRAVASQVNVTFEPFESNRLVLFDDRVPTNLTIIIRQKHDRLGALTFYFNLTSAIAKVNRSSQQSNIGVEGIPFELNVTSTDWNRFTDDVDEFRYTVELTGYRLGRSLLMVTAREQLTDMNADRQSKFESEFESEVYGSARYLVLVNRPPATARTTAFLFILIAGTTLNMLSFAVRLHGDVIRQHFRHPSPILIGLGCQFVILPALAYVLGLVFDLPAHVRYAMLVLGCCAGGGPSNFGTMILLGDIHMSVMMTSISNIFSIGLMPIWLITLGEVLMRADFPTFTVNIPWVALVILALLCSVPAVLGALFRRCVRERTALITSLAVRVVGIAAILVGVTGAVYSNVWVFNYAFEDWKTVLASCLMCHISYAIAYLFALIGRRSTQARVTIAIEAGVQNFATALFIVQLTCPQPESMTAAYTVVFNYLLNTIAGILVYALILDIPAYIRWKNKKSPAIIVVGFDTSASITDMYSISKADEMMKSELEMSTSSPGLGSRTGSFVQLQEKY